MTIKRKQRKLVGIVVAGASRNQASNIYNAVALGHDVVGLRDSHGNNFVTHASSQDMFNPTTGEQDLSIEEGSFIAEASNKNKEGQIASVSYTVCADGCNSHIISDLPLQFCPSCSSELPELSDDEIESLSQGIVEDNSDETVMAVIADTQQSAVDLFQELFDGEAVTYKSEAGTLVTHASNDVNFEPMLSIEDLELQLDSDFNSLSSEDLPTDVHVFQCAGECGSFTVTSSDHAVICMKCGSGLIEPDHASHSSTEADLAHLESELFSLSGDDEEDEDEDDFSSDEEDDDLGEDDDIDSIDLGDEGLDDDEFSSESSDDDLDEDLDEDDFDLDEDEDEDDFSSESSDDDLDEDLDEDDFDLDEDEDDFSSESSEDEDEDEEIEGFDLDEDEDEDEDEDDFSSESTTYEDLEVDLLSSISAVEDLDAKRLTVISTGKIEGETNWLALYGRVPVALASESSVSRNETLKDLFHKPSFGLAVCAAAANDGIEQALKDFNFDRISPEINIEATISQAVMQKAEARVTEIQENYEYERSQMKDRIGAALATASMGINRNVFTGVTNPVAGRLIAALSAAGVGNASELVTDAFVESSDKYNELLVGQAMELLQKPLETQNEIATFVANASHTSHSSPRSSIENRLANWEETAPKVSKLEAAPIVSQSSAAVVNKWAKFLEPK